MVGVRMGNENLLNLQRIKTHIVSGMRGFDTELARSFDYTSTGMEFATEIIGQFAKAGYPICELPATLIPDGRIEGEKHLRTFRDGMRHAVLMAKDFIK